MKPPVKKRKLTHIGPDNQPAMVDIGAKPPTRRTAEAEAVVTLPSPVARLFRDGDIRGPKGPVIQTAIIAGTQAVKDTARLIPFCHPLPLDRCSFTTQRRRSELILRCTVSAVYKTGVEMEALTGVTVAALTVYDMCKALSHDMQIRNIRLLRKTGGTSDVNNP